MQDKPSVADIRLKVERQRSILKRIVQSPDGKEAVECLKVKYSGNTFIQGDPYATHVRLGERGVVDYLISLQEED